MFGTGPHCVFDHIAKPERQLVTHDEYDWLNLIFAVVWRAAY